MVRAAVHIWTPGNLTPLEVGGMVECQSCMAGLNKMILPAGTKLETYQIVVPLGAVGRGEVYRVRDTRLDRRRQGAIRSSG